jgi:hypothetical protein
MLMASMGSSAKVISSPGSSQIGGMMEPAMMSWPA